MWFPKATLMPFFLGVLVASPAWSIELSPDAINSAEPSDNAFAKDKATPAGVRLQVLLDRAHFSPGEIDGKFGENAKKALRAYAKAQQLLSADKPTDDMWKALLTDDRPITSNYTISEKDVAGPFLNKLPAKMEDMKDIPKLGFTSPREAIAEKFHMSEKLLTELNPKKKFDRAGEAIVVVDTNAIENGEPAEANKVQVDKTRQTVKLFDKSNALIGFYPATVGSEEKPSPSGTLKVTEVNRNPTYRYNPDYHFKGVHSDKPFTINPAPITPLARCGSACRQKVMEFMVRRNREKCQKRNRMAACGLRTGTPSVLLPAFRRGHPLSSSMVRNETRLA
jgi:peptidoglycan hydrolase-like protein with peptidoglycan-binding domain